MSTVIDGILFHLCVYSRNTGGHPILNDLNAVMRIFFLIRTESGLANHITVT